MSDTISTENETLLDQVVSEIKTSSREKLEHIALKFAIARLNMTIPSTIDTEAELKTICKVCGHVATSQRKAPAHFGLESMMTAMDIEVKKNGTCPKECIGFAIFGVEPCPNCETEIQ